MIEPDIDVDSDNSLSIEDTDDPIENDKPGCFVIINDNDSGSPEGDDHENSVLDTFADKVDLEKLIIRQINPVLTEGDTSQSPGSLTLEVSDHEKIRIFDEHDQECIGPSSGINQSSYDIPWDEITESEKEFLIEGITDGEVTISLILKNSDGTDIGRDDLKVHVPKSFAIAGHGAQGGIHDALEDERAQNTGFRNDAIASASTGDELLSVLQNFCSEDDVYIGKLYIFSHGYWRGLILEDDSGFYSQSYENNEAATLADLATMLGFSIRFATNKSIVKLQACRTGEDTPVVQYPGFAQVFSQVIRGIVYGATGDCGYDYGPYGWFYSSNSPWRKFRNGVEIIEPHITDPDLTKPNQFGINYLRFY